MHLEKWKNCEANSILALRKEFRFNVNFRPVAVYPELVELSPLKPEVIAGGVDILFVRELNGDIYFGEHKTVIQNGLRVATDVAEYSEEQISRVAHAAFRAARKRRAKVTSVDKANVLDTSRLWRAVVREVAREYPEVTLEEMLVDNCAMQLIKAPAEFDVVLTTNMFGDILFDEAAILPGSLGLLCSASLNAGGFGMYEPPGGSAPDIAGKGIANPIGQILCVALMLRFSFGLAEEAESVERAVSQVLSRGLRTRDIMSHGGQLVGTREMGEAVARLI
jgi:3-isopropylmalate dehydrogenase